MAECLATRIAVSTSQFEYGACIIPSASSVRPPYEQLLVLTNEQDCEMGWSIGSLSTDNQEGCRGVFKVEPASGTLPPRGTETVKVLLSSIPEYPCVQVGVLVGTASSKGCAGTL